MEDVSSLKIDEQWLEWIDYTAKLYEKLAMLQKRV